MQYIPGFSNHLQQFAKGGRAEFVEEDTYGDAAPIMDTYQPAAVMPAAAMPAAAMPAAAPPYTLSGLTPEALAGLYALSANNAGGSTPSGIAGLPSLGAGYVPQFEEKLITAPVSNKGNATAYSGMDNQFYMSPNDFVRLVDRGTNTVVFEGTGYEAAQKAVEMGQNLTDTMGRKADYKIETGKTQDTYAPVASEKYNKSDLSKIANVAGTVLPMAMMAIPGVNTALLGAKFGASIPGQIALGALTGGASSGLKGQNILKGAALGGITAAGGALIPKIPAIGDLGNLARPIGVGVGSTVGNLATGQNLQNSLLSGAASGALAYAAPSIQRELGIGQGSGVSAGGGGDTSVSYGGPNADIIVNATPSFSAPINLGGFKTPAQKYLDDAASDDVSNPLTNAPYSSGYDGDLINVTGSTLIPGTNVNVGGSGTGALSTVTDTTLGQTGDTATEQIDVTGTKLIPNANVNVGGSGTGALSTVADTTTKGDDTKKDGDKKEIDVTGTKLIPGANVNVGGDTGALSTVTDTTTKGDDTKKADDTKKDDDKKEIDVTGTKLIPGTNVDVGDGFTLSDDTLKDINKKAAEEQEKKKKLGVEEYLRIASLLAGLIPDGKGSKGPTGYYGGSGSSRLNPIFSAKLPAAGGLGTIGATRTPRTLGDVDWLTYGTRPELGFFDYAQPAAAPVTTPVPGNPAGPIMAEDPPRMAQGGAFAAKRGGASKRTEFAVSGPGTGRSDDIPAVLSDGEYVIDAETVALLGDGSSKAGAKKLDELRVKVRKHKGQKLAKGRFSANAKNPEAYLSGGRV